MERKRARFNSGSMIPSAAARLPERKVAQDKNGTDRQPATKDIDEFAAAPAWQVSN